MNRRDYDQLRDHEFDGIKEYDNPLPRWWVWIFWATIIFTPLYIVYYHAGTGTTEMMAYNAEMDAFYEMQRQQLLALGEVSERVLRTVMDNEGMVGSGEKIFVGKCAQCHNADGGGNIGPNLTDDYWLHGGNLMDIYTVIKEGVPTKGMISWKKQLSEADMMSAAAYVATLQGTTPSVAKEAQGELFIREELPPLEEGAEGETAESETGETEALPSDGAAS